MPGFGPAGAVRGAASRPRSGGRLALPVAGNARRIAT